MRKMFLSVSDTGDWEENFQVHPTEIEPVSFWLLVYHYHWASGGLQVISIKSFFDTSVISRVVEYSAKMFFFFTRKLY